jgi:polysaccharide biosynthesis/export protein
MKKVLTLLIVALISFSAEAQNNTNEQQNTANQIMQLGMGSISVTIGGDFPITGSFPASPTERVDQFVTQIYTDYSEKMLARTSNANILVEIQKDLKKFTLRDITLQRSDGTQEKIDLQKFRLTGNQSLNPLLKNDDVLIFPAADLDKNFFTVTGAVNSPGKFYYVPGDKISDALQLAQGISKAYENVDTLKIFRLNSGGNKQEILNFTIGDTTVPIQRGDQIEVVAYKDQKIEYNVLVLGEVNKPGVVPITKNRTTIKDVISMAGGVADDASLKTAKLYSGNTLSIILEREYGIKMKDVMFTDNDTKINDMMVKLENQLMDRMSNADELSVNYLNLENELRVLTYGGPVNFSDLNDPDSETSKYIVKDGDVIIIPRNDHKVHVFGQVANPGSIEYSQGKDYNYYINKTGGLGEYAMDDIMLIKAASREWIPVDSDSAKVEEGDFIFVPRSLSHSFNYYLGMAQTFLSIIGSAATLILLLIKL